MSASSDHHSSGEEGSRSTANTNSPFDAIPYHPFRQLPWHSAHLNRPSGNASQRSSPGGNDRNPNRASFEGHSMDPRTFDPLDAYLPPLPSVPYPPSSTSDFNNVFNGVSQRSASDQASVFGRRPSEIPSWGSEPLSTSTGHGGYEGNNPQPEGANTIIRYPPRGSRPPYPRDEFDGPAQFLPLPLPDQHQSRAGNLLSLPVNLSRQEQDDVARRTNDILAQCAYHFIAKYQFPIPIERERRPVRQASDREWTEWAFLLKRLATKRRIPARVLYEGQIRQLVTTLENSIAVRQPPSSRAEASTARQDRDDRYILQLVSSALQVARILQDSLAMEQLNQLYGQTEALILERRRLSSSSAGVGNSRLSRNGASSGSVSALSPGPVGRPVGSGLVAVVGGGGGNGHGGGRGSAIGY